MPFRAIVDKWVAKSDAFEKAENGGQEKEVSQHRGLGIQRPRDILHELLLSQEDVGSRLLA